MEREFIFSILAFLITLGNTIVYWRGIIRKEIIPHPFTMFIWVVTLVISAIELVKNGEYLGSFSISFLALDLFFAMGVGFYFWEKIQKNWADWFFFFAGIGLIIFWQLEPNYTYVLIVMIAIDAMGYAPSFKKAWLQPFTEKALPYFISLGNHLCTILAITVWNFENLGMWIWTMGINLTFACFILWRQYSMKK